MKIHFILAEAIEIVKEFGYDVYITKYRSNRESDECRYCYITDGTNIAYMQVDDFNCGVNFSTVHLPNKNCGTSFRISNPQPLSRAFDSLFDLGQITKTIIESAFGKPQWAEKFRDVKYRSWDSYTKNSLSAKLGAEFIKM